MTEFLIIFLIGAIAAAVYVYINSDEEFEPTPAGDGSEPDRQDGFEDIDFDYRPKPLPIEEDVS